MKTVKITEILEYYDGIQIFAARDSIGGHYIGDMIDTVGDSDRYAVVGVSPERLADFQAGQVDLRTLLLESPNGEWYITVPGGTIEDPLVLEHQHKPLSETGHLPQDGYFLEPEEPRDYEAVRRALGRGKIATLTGSVEQVNRSTGEWGLLTGHGVKTGKTYPGGAVLDGLQVGKLYRFHCAEVAELDPLWRDRQVLYLQSIETA